VDKEDVLEQDVVEDMVATTEVIDVDQHHQPTIAQVEELIKGKGVF
jgi:hypothetical protein